MSLPEPFDPGPMARFEEVRADAAAPQEVFLRLTEHRTKLRDIAKSWGCAVGPFVAWFSTEHAELYDRALKVRADDLVHGALDTAAASDDPKLEIETSLKIASSWDRSRYGAKDHGPVGGVQVFVDRSCGGAVRVGVKDAGGNQAAISIGSTEPPARPAEIL